MTLIVGLTGGIGSGKSTVGQYFVDLGIDVIDTDAIARMLTEPDGLAMNSIKDSFGQTMLAADGSLNREKMRNLIFSEQCDKRPTSKVRAKRDGYILIEFCSDDHSDSYDSTHQRGKEYDQWKHAPS